MLFSYIPNSGYDMLSGTATTTVGNGYWLATDTGFTWTMSGTPSYESVAHSADDRLESLRLPDLVSRPNQRHSRLFWRYHHDMVGRPVGRLDFRNHGV